MKQRKSSDIRNSAEKKILEISESMKKRKNNKNYLTYEDALINFISPDLIEYCDSPAYKFLCIQLRNYVEEEFSKENVQALQLARENFIEYTKFMKEKHDRINE